MHKERKTAKNTVSFSHVLSLHPSEDLLASDSQGCRIFPVQNQGNFLRDGLPEASKGRGEGAGWATVDTVSVPGENQWARSELWE